MHRPLAHGERSRAQDILEDLILEVGGALFDFGVQIRLWKKGSEGDVEHGVMELYRTHAPVAARIVRSVERPTHDVPAEA